MYQALQPLLALVCCVIAWALLAIFLSSIWVAARDGIARMKRLHRIPCSRCQFFTGEYTLKCTVHPISALTEEAIDCSDFCPRILYHRSRQLYRSQ